MTLMPKPSARRDRYLIYAVATALVIGLMIVGVATWRSAQANREAEAKADQLIAEINARGAHAPSQDQVVNLLGSDGGAVCANPNAALARAGAMAGITNGAAGPGTRPVIAAERILRGVLVVIGIYCPDKLPDFQRFVDELKTGG